MSSKAIRKWKKSMGWMTFPTVKKADSVDWDSLEKKSILHYGGKSAECGNVILQPLNLTARKQMSRDKSFKPRRIVYFVRFRSLKDTSQSFLKVGITRFTVEGRYIKELEKNFTLETLAQTRWLGDRKARAIEGAILAKFQEHKFRPNLPLFSGNSECFVDTEEVFAGISTILAGLVQ